MTRFLRQPRWLAWHLLLVAVLVAFGWLGDWQLGSFEDKADRVPPETRPVVALDRLSKPGGRLATEDIGRRVRTSGTYDERRTLLVPDRLRPGSDNDGPRGLLVVTPLRTSSGVLPVVRGWVPSVGAPATAAPPGRVAVTGFLQRSEPGPPGGASPVVRPDRLPYVATVTLLDALPYHPSELYDGYLALLSETPAPSVRPVTGNVAFVEPGGGVSRWRNLAYALQWWLFAGAAVFFWWLVIRRSVTDRRRPPPDPETDRPELAAPRRTT